MCFDIQTVLESQLKRAKKLGNEDWIKELDEELDIYKDFPYYHVSGFSHPKLIIYTQDEPYKPVAATWGLVPFWVKNEEQKNKLWNGTLNARGETLFDKASFKNSAKNKRCLLQIDGFYEHHHYKGKTYPFYIYRKDKQALTLAGLWDNWLNRDTDEIMKTFTIVTTKGNDLLTKIHNNPKLKEPRMPFLLSDDLANDWLNPNENKDDITNLIQPYPNDELVAYTVRRLRGKTYLGNVKTISERFEYADLEF